MAKNKELTQDQTATNEVNLDQVEGEAFMNEKSDAQVASEAQATDAQASDAAATASVTGTTEGEASEAKEFTGDNGQLISRSAYIRQEFNKNRTRGDIAKELAVAYGIVYSATANMENSHHTNNGDGTVNRGAVVKVQTDDGEKTMSRADYARQEVGKGRSRGDVSKELGVAYATVYAATKDIEVAGGTAGGTARKLVEIEVDGVTKHVPRAQYIREEFKLGKTRRQIADELHCDYAVVWAATKGMTEGTELANADTTTEAAAEVSGDATATVTEDSGVTAADPAEQVDPATVTE